jgi:hypothetical protein
MSPRPSSRKRRGRMSKAAGAACCSLSIEQCVCRAEEDVVVETSTTPTMRPRDAVVRSGRPSAYRGGTRSLDAHRTARPSARAP